MRAADRPDAPILRPTRRFGAFPPAEPFAFEPFGSGRLSEMSLFQNGCAAFGSFFCFGSFFALGSFGALGLRRKEMSFLSSDCSFSFGSGGSSEAGTGGWIPGAGSAAPAAGPRGGRPPTPSPHAARPRPHGAG